MPWYTSKFSPRSFKAAETRANRLRDRAAAIRTLDKRGEPVTEAAIAAVLAEWEPTQNDSSGATS